MTKSPGRDQLPARFRGALLLGWIVLATAGLLYARTQHIPRWAAIPALAAFLIEYSFYLLPALPELRKRLAGGTLRPLLAVSILLPYLACYTFAGHLESGNLIRLAALALTMGLWYVVLPINVVSDLAFLALLGALLLSRFFERVYPPFYPGLPIAILGRIALFHMAALVLMVQREIPETGYGLLPTRREWRIGTVHYLCFLLPAASLAFPLKAVHLAPPAPLWKTIGIFLAFLWVVALFEEFIFRGVLQQWLEDWVGGLHVPWHPRGTALVLASLIFGTAHLWFRGFPNWRWALLAALLGWFCGHARNQAGSIRAGVVTHALVVATWRGFFA
jgi:uncharacterized protein